MRISLNWLKKYVDIKGSDEELIRLIGARLVEVEGVIDESHKYDKIYVVRVETAEKIPDTHLTLCQINVGGPELVQVVCGAPNVREGMLAAWIAPGAIVPASVNEDAPFVIGKRKMLGKYDSNGMLAGADELDFGDDHSGIVEIDPEIAKPGDLLADVFGLNDSILEIENKSLTHRPDCFGLIGFAREVHGILGNLGEFSVENFAEDLADLGGESGLSVSIADASICERYTALVLEKHGEIRRKYLSFIDTILAKSGMRPIDPIVDATNYLMLLTGQPLHAFDYDKFVKVGGGEAAKIIVRLANEGEKLELLDGREVELTGNDIVICSSEVPVALAGAMGGKSTEIDSETRKIILESATFSLYNLRKTQMKHGIFSEAITRFTKGQAPNQTLTVAKECAKMLSGGFRVSEVVDVYPGEKKTSGIKVSVGGINGLLGTECSEELILKTLESVNFKVSVDGGMLNVLAPEWRTDIHIPEDIIEEVGRLLGYDNIAPVLPLHGTAGRNKMWELKTRVREILSSFGANETLTYSFVSERLLEKAGLGLADSYKIVNSISPELQYVRPSIVPSLLDKAFVNQKIPYDKFALFEMNKVYQKALGLDAEGVPVEKMRLGFVVAERKGTGTAYYKAKRFVDELFGELGISAEYVPVTKEYDLKTTGQDFSDRGKNGGYDSLAAEYVLIAPFEEKRAAKIYADGIFLGVVGEFKNSVRRNFKLAEYLAGFELDLDAVLAKVAMKKIGSFKIQEKLDETVTTNDEYVVALKKIQEKYPEAKISPVSIYQAEGAEAKNITFHIEFDKK
ncbi:MAG: phenylalanine--tRNA ligase subunit beta [Candidatus Saccharibacteria bacterium]|nr:phenylalanine--tRNA ligase subunit beta [Candidatus Saccharibacteria bacterium]